MGLWKLLTTPIRFGSALFGWREPLLFRLRLRGDLLPRMLYAAAAWALATGVLLALFAFNIHGPSVWLAIGLGAVLGLGPAAMAFFARRPHASGRIDVYQDRVRRVRQYASFPLLTTEETVWPYPAVTRAVFVPGQSLGKSFSVLALMSQGRWDIIGLPASIDPRKLAGHLAAQGVQVSTAQQLPAEFVRPLGWPGALIAPLVGLLLLSAGAVLYALQSGGAAGGPAVADREPLERPPRVARRGDRAEPAPALSRAAAAVPSDPDQPADPNQLAGRAYPETLPPQSALPDAPRERVSPLGPAAPHPSHFSAAPDALAFTPSTSPPLDAGIPGDPPPFPSPAPQLLTSAPQGSTRTPAVGGSGGVPFETASPTAQPILGLSVRLAPWAGQQRIAELQPIYDRSEPSIFSEQALARDGYAVGAIQVDVTDFIDAVAIAFMRIKPNGELDPSDSYTGEWIGTRSGSPPSTLSGAGKAIIGLHGRRAAILDSLGLIINQ